jgi:heme/copper-type cytochrome/quinol oxidase subunit 2
LYAFVLAPLLIAFLIPILAPAFAQEAGEFVNRKIEIWALFYRFMTAAFVVGAVVTGVMVFIIVHFNEKNVKKREVAR